MDNELRAKLKKLKNKMDNFERDSYEFSKIVAKDLKEKKKKKKKA